MAGLWLLVLLVLPSQLPLKLPLTPEQIDLALGELLGCVGFLALLVGSRAVASPRLFSGLLGTVLFYQCLLARTCELWTLPDGARGLSPAQHCRRRDHAPARVGKGGLAATLPACLIDCQLRAVDFTAEQPRKLRAAAPPQPKL